MKLGFLYAGQGSQHPGMGADLYERFPTFRAVLDSAAARVDFDLKEVSFTDAKGVLNQTRYTQPCMVAFAAGITALLAERGIVPAAAAGLSLGEYSALHAAGVFDADTAVELVAFRGKAMEDAAAGRPSAMVAVLGLGRAICLELARGGANVVFCYAGNEAAANETAAACESLGAKAVALRCDVSKEDEVKALMDAALKTFGRIDILVNNAGITRDNLLMLMKPEDFDAVISANLKGTFLCMKAAARQMVKQRYGRIVNLSSVVGLRGNAGQVNYAASKAGVIGMTKSLAKELAGRNITVNAVAPGFIDTDMTAALTDAARTAALGAIPMGRMGAPEDVARAVAFLAGDSAAYITGQVLAVDGGMSM